MEIKKGYFLTLIIDPSHYKPNENMKNLYV